MTAPLEALTIFSHCPDPISCPGSSKCFSILSYSQIKVLVSPCEKKSLDFLCLTDFTRYPPVPSTGSPMTGWPPWASVDLVSTVREGMCRMCGKPVVFSGSPYLGGIHLPHLSSLWILSGPDGQAVLCQVTRPYAMMCSQRPFWCLSWVLASINETFATFLC